MTLYMSVFSSKKEVKLFLCRKSVELQKHFELSKSEPGRIVVKCTKNDCTFKLVFRGNEQGVFVPIEEQGHTCSSTIPTIKRVWIRQIAAEMKLDKKVTAGSLKDYIKDKFDVDVDKTLVKNALADAKMKQEDDRLLVLLLPFSMLLQKKMKEQQPAC